MNHIKHHRRFLNKAFKKAFKDKDVEIARLKLELLRYSIENVYQEQMIEAGKMCRDTLENIVEFHKQNPLFP